METQETSGPPASRPVDCLRAARSAPRRRRGCRSGWSRRCCRTSRLRGRSRRSSGAELLQARAVGDVEGEVDRAVRALERGQLVEQLLGLHLLAGEHQRDRGERGVIGPQRLAIARGIGIADGDVEGARGRRAPGLAAGRKSWCGRTTDQGLATALRDLVGPDLLGQERAASCGRLPRDFFAGPRLGPCRRAGAAPLFAASAEHRNPRRLRGRGTMSAPVMVRRRVEQGSSGAKEGRAVHRHLRGPPQRIGRIWPTPRRRRLVRLALDLALDVARFAARLGGGGCARSPARAPPRASRVDGRRRSALRLVLDVDLGLAARGRAALRAASICRISASRSRSPPRGIRRPRRDAARRSRRRLPRFDDDTIATPRRGPTTTKNDAEGFLPPRHMLPCARRAPTGRVRRGDMLVPY